MAYHHFRKKSLPAVDDTKYNHQRQERKEPEQYILQIPYDRHEAVLQGIEENHICNGENRATRQCFQSVEGIPEIQRHFCKNYGYRKQDQIQYSNPHRERLRKHFGGTFIKQNADENHTSDSKDRH